MKQNALIIIISATLTLVGCASYTYTDAPPSLGPLYSKYAVIGYEGEIQDLDSVGIVTTDGLIKITSVDGKPLSRYRTYLDRGFYSGGRFQLHLEPGEHDLTLAFSDDRGGSSRSWSTEDIYKKITIERKQILHLSLHKSWNSWDAKKHDGSSARSIVERDFHALRKE
jgi:hypothetical protein